jgi:hypothetical protein
VIGSHLARRIGSPRRRMRWMVIEPLPFQKAPEGGTHDVLSEYGSRLPIRPASKVNTKHILVVAKTTINAR